MRVHAFAVYALLAGLTACASTPPEEAVLDVPLAPNRAQASVPFSPLPKVPAEAAFDWHQFFRPPPSQSERTAISQNLKRWNASASVPELLIKAHDEVRIGNLAAAEVSFRECLRSDSENPEALIGLASLYLQKTMLRKTFEVLAQIKDQILSRENVDRSFILRYRYLLAVTYIAQKRHKDGHAILTDLLSIDRTFVPAYGALASSYLFIGKVDLAEFIVKRGIDRAGKDPSLANLMGVIAQERHHLDVAESWFNEALEVNQEFIPALINKARLMIDRHDFETAQNLLTKAIRLDEHNDLAYVILGIVQNVRGATQDAEASFKKAVAINPNSAEARYNLGIYVLNQRSRPGEAVRHFHEVLRTGTPNKSLQTLAASNIDDLKRAGEK